MLASRVRAPRFMIPAIALLIAACGVPRHAADPITRDGGRVYTAEQIAQMDVSTAWDVVEKVGNVDLWEASDGRYATVRTRRGQNSIYLQSADEPIMMLDGVRFDDPRVLRDVRARSIQELRIVGGIEATQQQGTNAGAGLISIITKSAPDSI